MSYQVLLYEKYEGKVALTTLNRPHPVNAISQQMQKDLNQVLDEIESDGEVNIFVLTGAPRPDGRPAFWAGADLRENAERRQGVAPPETPSRLAKAIINQTVDMDIERALRFSYIGASTLPGQGGDWRG